MSNTIERTITHETDTYHLDSLRWRYSPEGTTFEFMRRRKILLKY
jgi:hypothetical protein